MKARAALALLVVALALCASCKGRDQWIIEASTDAPVPAWGDRVLFEVLDDDGQLACDDCRREFAVDASSFPLSFGVVPSAGGASHVRGRFYRSEQAGPDGLPQGASLIDFLGRLPPSQGPTHVLLPLSALCFGKPSDFENHMSCSLVATTGTQGTLVPEDELLVTPDGEDFDLTAAKLLPGDIDQFGAPCPTDSIDGMVCVPPQAFLMGSARSVGVDSDYPSQPQVVVQPVLATYVDVDEVTVGAVRMLVKGGILGASGILRRGDAGAPAACTYLGTADATNDALPMNCISQLSASLACTALGKNLMTEIDFERVAANGGKQTFYPWGEDAPTCDRAVLSVDASCTRAGPLAGGSTNDVNDDGIRNLGGNLSEWVADIFVPYTDPCWTETHLDSGGCSDDPRLATWTGPWSHRGGSWSRRGSSAASFARFASPDGGPSPDIGFRCTQPAPLAP